MDLFLGKASLEHQHQQLPSFLRFSCVDALWGQGGFMEPKLLLELAISSKQIASQTGDSLLLLFCASATLQPSETSSPSSTRQSNWRVQCARLLLFCCAPATLGTPLAQLASQTGESHLPQIASNTGKTSASCHPQPELANAFQDLHGFYVKNDTMQEIV